MRNHPSSLKLRQKLLQDAEVPKGFYKYLRVGDWLEDMLNGKSLKFTSRTEFNDPYDCRCGYQVDVTTDAGRQYVLDAGKRVGLKGADLLRYFNRIKNQSRLPRPFLDGETDRLLDKTGILSLASRWDNHLLWAHYAKHHQGICVEFAPTMDVFRVALPVTYSGELPIIRRPTDTTDELLRKALLTKAECWRYEEEWRIIKRVMSDEEQVATRERDLALGMPEDEVRILTDQRGVGFYQFDPRAIRSITLGMHAEEVKQDVVMAMRRSELNVPLYQVEKPGVAYGLTRRLVKVPKK